MGLTIHYKGILKKPEMVYSLIEEMCEVAETMDWRCQVIDNDWDLPDTSHIASGGRILGHSALKGVILILHNKCEPIFLLFDARGTLQSPVSMALKKNKLSWQHTKTQFAPIEVHISIVKLMKYLSSKYFEQFEVIDEGEFWETDDIALLTKKRSYLGDLIDKVGEVLEKGLEDDYLSGLTLIDRIEAILSKLSKKS
ncbi:MAG: hypothetical protein ACFHWX_11245 [Bacteroidota bacterium]